MSNVVSMTRTCDYLVHRAAARRRKGNYVEAMTLLTRARDQYGLCEDVELEIARIYDELDCEEEANRAYLRVVRLAGRHRGEALLQLSVSALQRADLTRAQSYYRMLLAADQTGISAEYIRMLGQQLDREANGKAKRCTRKARAKALVARGVERLHAGKTTAARRALNKALTLGDNARTHTLLACCYLLEGDAEQSIAHAREAQKRAPLRVQALLVMADAYAMAGDEKKALRALRLAAARARDIDDYLATALESAKRGQDRITLQMTKKLLGMDPQHPRAMLLRGCALSNLGEMKEAAQLFARVCVLMPENAVCETLYSAAREGQRTEERLTLGMEVTHAQGVAWAVRLIEALYQPQEMLLEDLALEKQLCKLAIWAFHSPLAGEQVATAALLVMRHLDTAMSRCVLQDALTDPQIDDEFKLRVLQVLSSMAGPGPHLADIGGRMVTLTVDAAQQNERTEMQDHADDAPQTQDNDG